ncbi:sigma-70 family RNA polymerase sigma factor [candidate division FCPU426 bacterium]|nr:sigma-70 family RNA polymerase sigma factor [candidate division FCPU426 bacterium]
MILEDIMKITDLFKPAPAAADSLELRFARGDMDAMEEIMRIHHNSIYQLGLRLFASRDLAADFYQDVFIRIYEKRHHYRPDRPLKPWLYQVALNLGRDRLRRKREISLEEASCPEPAEMPRMEEEAIAAELKQKVWGVMESLSPIYRETLALRFSSDMSMQEIADALGISLSAAKVRLCRGLKSFEDAFRAQGGEMYVL